MSRIPCPTCHWLMTPGLTHVCNNLLSPPTEISKMLPGGPPGPGPKMGGPTASPQDRKLNRPIWDVYKANNGVKCMLRYNTDLRKVLTDPPNAVEPRVVDALVTVIANKSTGNSLASARADDLLRTTIRDFKRFNKAQQLELISNIWDLITNARLPTKLHSDMYDPPAVVGKMPVPSSFCPTTPGQNNFAKRLDANATAWKTLGVGFRIDGKVSTNDEERIRASGLTSWASNPAVMRAVSGWEIEGTVLQESGRVRLWTANDDILNETAVCIARNFFGACAFPYRSTVEDDLYLWAASCQGLLGFDTEKYQIDLGKNRQWRPGEKAYLRVPPENVIGYVLVSRRGEAQADGGWKFFIKGNAQWKILNPTVKFNSAVLDYINGELNAWRGYEYSISPEYDFAT